MEKALHKHKYFWMIEEQRKDRKKIVLEDKYKDITKIRKIGGVDLAMTGKRAICVLVIFDARKKKPIQTKICFFDLEIPYIPGLLSYREGPGILKLLRSGKGPDILLVDGNGIAHPRGVGLATWVGLRTGTPTIGIAKSRLVGDYNAPKGIGEASPWFFEGKQIGWVLKPERGRPIFISPGHLVSIKTSLRIVKEYLLGHRLPEPVWLADKETKRFRKALDKIKEEKHKVPEK